MCHFVTFFVLLALSRHSLVNRSGILVLRGGGGELKKWCFVLTNCMHDLGVTSKLPVRCPCDNSHLRSNDKFLLKHFPVIMSTCVSWPPLQVCLV